MEPTLGKSESWCVTTGSKQLLPESRQNKTEWGGPAPGKRVLRAVVDSWDKPAEGHSNASILQLCPGPIKASAICYLPVYFWYTRVQWTKKWMTHLSFFLFRILEQCPSGLWRWALCCDARVNYSPTCWWDLVNVIHLHTGLGGMAVAPPQGPHLRILSR